MTKETQLVTTSEPRPSGSRYANSRKSLLGKRSVAPHSILYTVLLPTILLFCGLAIDLSMLYVVQTRLSSAVDGAALGAGRLLGTQANTNEIAGEFLNANYPAGFWGTYNLAPTITVTTVASLHTIAVSATVQAPLLFLWLLRQQNCTVAASATAVRRDVRVELVLDRSYSMISQMANLRTATTNFVKRFNPGTDELGLVVLSGSSFVAYPPSEMPNYSLTSGPGPDEASFRRRRYGHQPEHR